MEQPNVYFQANGDEINLFSRTGERLFHCPHELLTQCIAVRSFHVPVAFMYLHIRFRLNEASTIALARYINEHFPGHSLDWPYAFLTLDVISCRQSAFAFKKLLEQKAYTDKPEEDIAQLLFSLDDESFDDASLRFSAYSKCMQHGLLQ